MLVTYRPDGGEAQEWRFDPDKIRESEAEMIEKRAGQAYDSWRTDIIKGAARARRVLLWHLIRRTHHTLRWEDTPDPYRAELLVEYTAAELQAMRDELAKGRIDDERQELLDGLDAEIAAAAARDGEEGKAPSSSDESSTGSTSPTTSTSLPGSSES